MIKGLVDKHAAVKLRATDAPALFDYTTPLEPCRACSTL